MTKTVRGFICLARTQHECQRQKSLSRLEEILTKSEEKPEIKTIPPKTTECESMRGAPDGGP